MLGPKVAFEVDQLDDMGETQAAAGGDSNSSSSRASSGTGGGSGGGSSTGAGAGSGSSGVVDRGAAVVSQGTMEFACLALCDR